MKINSFRSIKKIQNFLFVIKVVKKLNAGKDFGSGIKVVGECLPENQTEGASV